MWFLFSVFYVSPIISLFLLFFVFFFFNDTATTEIYTLSLHDAHPIPPGRGHQRVRRGDRDRVAPRRSVQLHPARSEEHTSELQSLAYLVCRLLLEKKKKIIHTLNPLKKKKKNITKLF